MRVVRSATPDPPVSLADAVMVAGVLRQAPLTSPVSRVVGTASSIRSHVNQISLSVETTCLMPVIETGSTPRQTLE